MTEADRFSVLLAADPPAAVGPVSEVLAELRGVPVLDTAREARSSWGIVAENQTDDDARRLVAALGSRGIAAFAVPPESVPDLPPLQPATRIEIEEEGFRCRLISATTPLIPWTAPVMAAAAIVKATVVKTETRKEGPSPTEKWVRRGIMMTTGLPLPGGKSKSVEVRREEMSLLVVLDIALARPAARIRLEAANIDYSTLGDRRGYDSLGNFRILAADVARRLPEPVWNHGLRIIATQGPIMSMGYERMEEFEREERWMLARRALG